MYAVCMPEKGARRLGVATETTGVVRGCSTWEPPKRWPFWNTKGEGQGVMMSKPLIGAQSQAAGGGERREHAFRTVDGVDSSHSSTFS